MNKKGFTLVELLGVIVVMGVLLTMVGISANGIIKRSRAEKARIEEGNLRDVAVSYAKAENIRLAKCQAGYIVTSDTDAGECRLTILVSDLKNNGYFENKSNSCDDNGKIVIYRYVNPDNGLDEYRAYVKEGTCN